MISLAAASGIALVELGLVLTPGPNMIYLVSRSISQGWRAGMTSSRAWMRWQRWVTGTLLGAIGIKLAVDAPTPAVSI
ncbi:hypothetical protein GCM10025760_20740 [Microbacterium yannicii]|uniref:LysE family translocator n=1 Tax=Microbacterium yannicii TaxID=671622 RepID=A0ABP9M8G8_9MICO|nr:hypothetical protein [Microbacterium yannicii]MCO5952462.1 hypothetical protein [Microbacterium yannicii]